MKQFLNKCLIQNNISQCGLLSPLRCASTSIPFFGKFSRVNFVNTSVQLKGDDLEVNRTSYLGLKTIPDIVLSSERSSDIGETLTESPKLFTSDDSNILSMPDEISPIEEVSLEENQEVELPEDSYCYMDPTEKYSLQELPEKKKQLFEKFRGSLFLYFPEGVQLINYYFVHNQNIAWNQTTLLSLLMFIRELNGDTQPQIKAEDYHAELKKCNIKSANWVGSIKKNFEIKLDKEGKQVIFYNKGVSESSEYAELLEENFRLVESYFKDSCEYLSSLLESAKKAQKIPAAHSHVIHTLACLSTCEKISFKDIFSSLTDSGISTANFHYSLTSKTMTPIFIIDKSEMTIALPKNKYLVQILRKHASELAKVNSVLKKESHSKLDQIFHPVTTEQLINPIEKFSDEEKNDQVSRSFRLNGYVSVINPTDPKVYAHLPNSQFFDNMDTRKLVIALALKALSQTSEATLSFSKVNEILKDNRLSKILLPRDLVRKDEFSCNFDAKTVTLKNSKSYHAIFDEIRDYRVREKDITEKMKEVIPIIHELTTKNRESVVSRLELSRLCKEKGIVLNLPRDFSRLFGFVTSDKIYVSPRPFKQAVSLVPTNKEKKKGKE